MADVLTADTLVLELSKSLSAAEESPCVCVCVCVRACVCVCWLRQSCRVEYLLDDV